VYILLLYVYTLRAKIESSPVWDTFCLAELIYDLIDRQFLCEKCCKPVTIQYLHTGDKLRGVGADWWSGSWTVGIERSETIIWENFISRLLHKRLGFLVEKCTQQIS